MWTVPCRVWRLAVMSHSSSQVIILWRKRMNQDMTRARASAVERSPWAHGGGPTSCDRAMWGVANCVVEFVSRDLPTIVIAICQNLNGSRTQQPNRNAETRRMTAKEKSSDCKCCLFSAGPTRINARNQVKKQHRYHKVCPCRCGTIGHLWLHQLSVQQYIRMP